MGVEKNFNNNLLMFEVQKDIILERYQIDKRTFDEYLNGIQIKIISYLDNKLEFDLIGVDCSIANAIRRILISEVPSIAIEKVIITDYNGVMPEEILSHRLGLLPVCVDPSLIQYKGEESDEQNTLKFVLKIKHNQNEETTTVMSDDIQWVPIGNQKTLFQTFGELPYIKKGIPITKICAGQEISLEMLCEKNIGKEHAKWTPVCPVTYRLHPMVRITEDFYDDEAKKLEKCFSKGVIELIKTNDGRLKAVVANERADLVSREALRHKEFEGRVFLGRKSNHYIFTLESVFMDPFILVKQSIAILGRKCAILRQEIEDTKE